jgi:signal peptidase I
VIPSTGALPPTVADRRARRSVEGARRRVGRRILAALTTVLVLTLVASVTGLLPVRIVRVESGSMAPTLADGDLVLLERDADGLRRRDVVVVRHPDTGEQLIKRAVALGGDRVNIEDGVLLVNGAPVCEPSIDPDRIDGVFFQTVTVPAGQVFLLGDDRQSSIDSRDFGPLGAGEVLGLVRTRLWPAPGALPQDSC